MKHFFLGYIIYPARIRNLFGRLYRTYDLIKVSEVIVLGPGGLDEECTKDDMVAGIDEYVGVEDAVDTGGDAGDGECGHRYAVDVRLPFFYELCVFEAFHDTVDVGVDAEGKQFIGRDDNSVILVEQEEGDLVGAGIFYEVVGLFVPVVVGYFKCVVSQGGCVVVLGIKVVGGVIFFRCLFQGLGFFFFLLR